MPLLNETLTTLTVSNTSPTFSSAFDKNGANSSDKIKNASALVIPPVPRRRVHHGVRLYRAFLWLHASPNETRDAHQVESSFLLCPIMGQLNI